MWCLQVLLFYVGRVFSRVACGHIIVYVISVFVSMGDGYIVVSACIFVSLVFVYVWAIIVSVPTLFVFVVNDCNSVDDSCIYASIGIKGGASALAKALGQPILHGCFSERPLCKLSNRLRPCILCWFWGNLARWFVRLQLL